MSSRIDKLEAAGFDRILKSKIVPEYTEGQFLREAWISLVREDAPTEVFEADFEPVCLSANQVVGDQIEVDVDYRASLGYERQEPYIANETYYVNEPYTTTETYYDTNLKQNRERVVTRYRKVQKERSVTRYKTVVDWSPFRGEHRASSVTTIENRPDVPFDESVFFDCLDDYDVSTLVSLSEEEAAELNLTPEACRFLTETRATKVRESVTAAAPGDYIRDLEFSVTDVVDGSISLFYAPYYEASLPFQGKTYRKQSYAFGKMKMTGDRIENDQSLQSVKQRMKDDMRQANEERQYLADLSARTGTSRLSWITAGVLGLSILVSLFLRSYFLVITCFLAAVGLFIYTTVKVNNTVGEENRRAEQENGARIEETEAAIRDISKHHKETQMDLLNEKLTSLGLEPASATEVWGRTKNGN